MSKYIINLLILLTCAAVLVGCTGSASPDSTADATVNESTGVTEATEDGFDYFYGPEESTNVEEVPPEDIEGDIPADDSFGGSDSGYIDIPIEDSADVDSEQEILDEYYNSGEGQP